MMATFPVLTCKGNKKGYVEDLNEDAVNVASKASGLPVLNKLFTFDGMEWKYTLDPVLDADKLTLITFYHANKDIPFNWLNPQDDSIYEVIFMKPPKCTPVGSDGTNLYWKIVLSLRQYSPL